MNNEARRIILDNELYEEVMKKKTLSKEELLHIFAKQINILQSRIDKAIDWIEKHEKQIGTLGETNRSIVLTDDVVIGSLLEILKGE